MTHKSFHNFYLKVLQQHKYAFDIICSCETLCQLSAVEPWFDNIYKNWVKEFYLIARRFPKEAVTFGKELDEVTDYMFEQIRSVIAEKRELINEIEKKKKAPVVVTGFCPK